MKRKSIYVLTLVLAIGLAGSASAQEPQGSENEELAKELANPVASLVSVPIQFNYDDGYGSRNGRKAFANLQPVVPFALPDNLSLVVRTILPIAWQEDVAGGSGTQFGLGDTLQSFFFVPPPLKTRLGTLSYGVGPAITWPTSTERLLGAGAWALGPTGVGLVQQGPWTYGALVNHQWGIADTRNSVPYVNNTFVQPFVAYTTKDAWTFTVTTESSYNWTSNSWSVPLNATVSKLTSMGSQRISLQAGVRYWATSPGTGPDGFGVRFAVVFLLPK